MGLGSWCAGVWDRITDTACQVKDYAVDCYDTIKEKVSDGYDAVKSGCTRMWNGVTGKNNYRKAEEVFDTCKKHEAAIAKYKEEIESLGRDLESKIAKINDAKNTIYKNHFIRFKSLADRLHNLNINGQRFIEFFDESIISSPYTTNVKNKANYFKIDFNNLSFKTKCFGILTFGYTTRKAAKETLEEVTSLEVVLREDVSKIKAQLSKVRKIIKSISEIENYFDVIIDSYAKLLDRFEYGIKTQTYKTVLDEQINIKGKLNFKEMPIVHIEEFQALFNLSIILKKMSSLGYLGEAGELIEHDIKTHNNLKLLVNQYELVAA